MTTCLPIFAGKSIALATPSAMIRSVYAMSRRALNAFWIVLVTCGVAAAEPDPKKHAAELAAESQTHYKRGEFEISVALLRQAYALYPEPNLQYNLGRSLASRGDATDALEPHENYLANG